MAVDLSKLPKEERLERLRTRLRTSWRGRVDHVPDAKLAIGPPIDTVSTTTSTARALTMDDLQVIEERMRGEHRPRPPLVQTIVDKDEARRLFAQQPYKLELIELLDSLIPTGTPTVQRFQIQPQETRSMPQVNVKYYFDATTLAISGGLSDEPDYCPNFGSTTISHEFNDKLTTVSAGYGVTAIPSHATVAATPRIPCWSRALWASHLYLSQRRKHF